MFDHSANSGFRELLKRGSLLWLSVLILPACLAGAGSDAPSSTNTTRGEPPTYTQPATESESPSTPTPPPLTYPIGLEGELANIPAALADRYDWSQYGEYAEAVMTLYAAVGGRVTRINIALTRSSSMPDIEQYGYDVVDQLVAAAQGYGINVAMTVAYQRVLVGGRGVDLSQPWLWTNQAERDRYEAYLRAMVERYDGDGVDDAPGLLYPIRVWQIHNELEAQWVTAVDQGVTTWATPDDYAELLRFSAAVIRQEMPDALIVASNYPWPGRDAADFDGDGRPERYMERVAELGGYDDVDVVEIHDFTGDLTHLVDGLAYARRASGRTVWAGQVLAVNQPTDAEPDASPATQAQKLVKLLVGALATGAEHAHWWGLQNAPDEVPSSGGLVPVFAFSGLYAPCPDQNQTVGRVCADPPLYPAGVNFRALADAFVGYRGLTVIEPLVLGVVPGREDSSRAVVRVEREDGDPFVIAWDDAGGPLDLTGLFPGVARVRVTRFVTEEGITELPSENGVTGEVALSAAPVMISPDQPENQSATRQTATTVTSAPSTTGAATRRGPKGVFIAFHLEDARGPRLKTLWPKLEEFMSLADRYDVKVTLQFSWPWADYVYKAGLLDTVAGWEANGHEIALHHHGPTHKFFDGYTNDPDAVRTDGWYATDYGYLGDMNDLMEFLAPLSEKGITSAGMSDEETDWPEGVLYHATDSGETPSADDLLSRPVEKSYRGNRVIEIYNTGYEIGHLGEAAVGLSDVERALQTAAPDQYMGIVFNDETIEQDFDLIEPLFQLFERYGVEVETVSALMAGR